MVPQGRRRRRVVGRVPPARRRGGGRQERVAAAVVPAALPVQIVPPIRRRRRHPRRRRRRRVPSGACTQLRPPPRVTYARRRQLVSARASDLHLRVERGSQRRRRRAGQGRVSPSEHAGAGQQPVAQHPAGDGRRDAKRRRGAGGRSLAPPRVGGRAGAVVRGGRALICAPVQEGKVCGGWCWGGRAWWRRWARGGEREAGRRGEGERTTERGGGETEAVPT